MSNLLEWANGRRAPDDDEGAGDAHRKLAGSLIEIAGAFHGGG
jgi:hypothetical protein